MGNFDPKEFRDALGRFATGVTIVTAKSAEGRLVGVTANSYNSVSIDPPLILWSLSKTAGSMDCFMETEAFTVHILGEDQGDLAMRFASRGDNKYDGLDFELDSAGTPLLSGCASRLQCKTVHRYEGGDHMIFVGKVTSFDQCDKAPLIFHQGKFKQVEAHAAA